MSAGNNQLEGNLKGEDMLSDIRELSLSVMLKNGMPENKAAIAAESLVQLVRKDWGGLLIYFKKTTDLTDRDYEIYNRYNGRNRDQLCQEFDITVQRLYQIVKSIKSIEIARRQTNLFDMNQGDDSAIK
tara:strand:+ start:2456 stop:2842 length:387 start_codon:yes stop_codon:yes gene_type:complete